MKIAVCIKQVPGTTEVEIDPVTGVLKRDGIASKLNAYDLYALETALQLKSIYGGTVTAITMGPPQAMSILKESFAMNVDHAFLLSDRRFAGADVLATSYTLSQGIRAAGEFDLIICGKQTTDGDTAQVGSELAELLNIPHAANVCKVHDADEKGITVDQDLPLHINTLKLNFPCLIAVEKGIFEPRLPSYKLMKASADREIKVLSLDDFPDKDANHYGLNGSPTQVKRIFPPEHSSERESWTGSGEELAGKLYNYLENNKFLQFPG